MTGVYDFVPLDLDAWCYYQKKEVLRGSAFRFAFEIMLFREREICNVLTNNTNEGRRL